MSTSSSDFRSFSEQLRNSIRQEALNAAVVKVAKHSNVYNSGDRDGNVYFIESGQVKIVVYSKHGKECLLSIYSEGDVFGELCLADVERVETATAMNNAVLRRVACSKFLARLTEDGLLNEFVKYLTVRIAEQQSIITNLITVNSEQRLAATLLHIARKLGKPDPQSLRIEERITYEELAEMVGTTRSRIGLFMKRFRNLGLIEMNAGAFLVIKEHRIVDYLEQNQP